jgi:hypothetical protein
MKGFVTIVMHGLVMKYALRVEATCIRSSNDRDGHASELNSGMPKDGNKSLVSYTRIVSNRYLSISASGERKSRLTERLSNHRRFRPDRPST